MVTHIIAAVSSIMIDPYLLELHDENGNAPDLLSGEDRKMIRFSAWSRASGETICHECGQPFWKHPNVIGALWLRRICGNWLVKL